MDELHTMARIRVCATLLLLGVALNGCTLPSPAIIPTATPLKVGENFSGLSLEQFFETSWRALTERHPETILAEGLTEVYGVEEVSSR